MKFNKKLHALFVSLFLAVFLLTGCAPAMEDSPNEMPGNAIEQETDASQEDVLAEDIQTLPQEAAVEDETVPDVSSLSEEGTYTSKEDVAAYLHEYGHLPSNYLTKKAAKALGWVSNEGNLEEVAPGMSIGGDYFGNYEGVLPEADDREYHECDIDFDGTFRNAKRIVYSNDGLIYYTEDHYKTFELLYGEE